MMPFYEHDLFKPYVVYDVAEGRDAAGGGVGGSRYNLGEINLALALFQELRKFLISLMQRGLRPPPCQVGVITPYRCAISFSFLRSPCLSVAFTRPCGQLSHQFISQTRRARSDAHICRSRV
jgi:hypothetical protein